MVAADIESGIEEVQPVRSRGGLLFYLAVPFKLVFRVSTSPIRALLSLAPKPVLKPVAASLAKTDMMQIAIEPRRHPTVSRMVRDVPPSRLPRVRHLPPPPSMMPPEATPLDCGSVAIEDGPSSPAAEMPGQAVGSRRPESPTRSLANNPKMLCSAAHARREHGGEVPSRCAAEEAADGSPQMPAARPAVGAAGRQAMSVQPEDTLGEATAVSPRRSSLGSPPIEAESSVSREVGSGHGASAHASKSHVPASHLGSAPEYASGCSDPSGDGVRTDVSGPDGSPRSRSPEELADPPTSGWRRPWFAYSRPAEDLDRRSSGRGGNRRESARRGESRTESGGESGSDTGSESGSGSGSEGSGSEGSGSEGSGSEGSGSRGSGSRGSGSELSVSQGSDCSESAGSNREEHRGCYRAGASEGYRATVRTRGSDRQSGFHADGGRDRRGVSKGYSAREGHRQRERHSQREGHRQSIGHRHSTGHSHSTGVMGDGRHSGGDPCGRGRRGAIHQAGRERSLGTDREPDSQRGTGGHRQALSQDEGSCGDDYIERGSYERRRASTERVPRGGTSHGGDTHQSLAQYGESAWPTLVAPTHRDGRRGGESGHQSTCSSGGSSSIEAEAGARAVRGAMAEASCRPLTPQHWQSRWQPQRHCTPPSRAVRLPNIRGDGSEEAGPGQAWPAAALGGAAALDPAGWTTAHGPPHTDTARLPVADLHTQVGAVAAAEGGGGTGGVGSLLSRLWLGRADALSVPAELDAWDVLTVCDWLLSIGLGEYADNFRENHINGRALALLGRDDLAEMGVRSVGHRLAILRARAEASGGDQIVT